MTCIKNGAKIYFRNYSMLVVGDAYVVQDVWIFRWNPQSCIFTGDDSEATHIIEYIENSESWWHRKDLGITVIPRYLITVHSND